MTETKLEQIGFQAIVLHNEEARKDNAVFVFKRKYEATASKMEYDFGVGFIGDLSWDDPLRVELRQRVRCLYNEKISASARVGAQRRKLRRLIKEYES